MSRIHTAYTGFHTSILGTWDFFWWQTVNLAGHGSALQAPSEKPKRFAEPWWGLWPMGFVRLQFLNLAMTSIPELRWYDQMIQFSGLFLSAIFSKFCWIIFPRKHTGRVPFACWQKVFAQEFRGMKGRGSKDHRVCRCRNWIGKGFCHIPLRRLDCDEGRGWEGRVGIRMGCCSGVHWKRLEPMLELGDRIGWP